MLGKLLGMVGLGLPEQDGAGILPNSRRLRTRPPSRPCTPTVSFSACATVAASIADSLSMKRRLIPPIRFDRASGPGLTETHPGVHEALGWWTYVRTR